MVEQVQHAPIASTEDIPDEFFKFSKRDEMKGEYEPALMAVLGEQMKAFSARPEAFGFQTDLPAARKAFHEVMMADVKRTWTNWEETESKVDQTKVSVKVGDHFIKCWVHRPKGVDEKLPCIVFAHGGGGIWLSPETFSIWSREMALRLNCVMVMPTYRQAPEHKQPAGQEDFMRAFNYFHLRGAEHNIDTSKMAIAGESGGGLISLGAAWLMIKSGDISKVRTVFVWENMIIGEAIDLSPAERTQPEHQCMSQFDWNWVWSAHASDWEKQKAEKDPLVFPGLMPDEDLAKLPPTFVMTSELCFLRRDMINFAKRLISVGKLAGMQDIAGYDHSWAFNGGLPATDRFFTEFKAMLDSQTQ